jgi:hypothetical protein
VCAADFYCTPTLALTRARTPLLVPVPVPVLLLLPALHRRL